MTRYTVRQSYCAWRDTRWLGPWSEGDEVDLPDEDATWVERDAPGTLVASRQAEAPSDRQQKPSRNRGQR